MNKVNPWQFPDTHKECLKSFIWLWGESNQKFPVANKDTDLLENGLEDMGRGKGKL